MALARHARLSAWGFLAAGIGLALGLAAWQGFDGLAAAFATLGLGLLLLPLIFLPHLVLATWSWWLLFLPACGPGFWTSLRALWIGGSVNVLLPLASIGGEVVKARLLMLTAVRGTDAVASVVVDKTVQAISIVLWGLTGALSLLWVATGSDLILPVLAGSLVLALGVAGFIAVQLSDVASFLVKRTLGRSKSARWAGVVDDASAFEQTIRGLYRRHSTIAASCLLRYGARLTLTIEVWLVAHLLGHPITLLEALALKSLVGALRGAIFVVPSGWGIQEGGFILLGGLFGLPADATLALSLATRAREIAVSLAGLAAWQWIEARCRRGRSPGAAES